MTPSDRDLWECRAAKVGLGGIFLTGLLTFSRRIQACEQVSLVRPFDLLLLGLATFRAGRMLAYERIAEPLREPFTEVRPDYTGAGQTVVAKGGGLRFAIGELISCPVCIGTWIAAGLLYGMHVAPRLTRLFVAIQSVTGVAELLTCLTEALSWEGRAARRESATQSRT